MSGLTEALITAGAAVIGSLSLYGGGKIVSRNTRAVEDRKLNSSEFEVFKKAYQEQMADFEKRYDAQEAKVLKVERLLRLALRYILDLRSDMRRNDVNPTHAAPAELEALLWGFYGAEEDEPANIPPAPGD